MKALITGASSGIGKEMAYYLAELGYDLILVARREEKLNDIKDKVKTKVKIYPYDLSIEKNVYSLYEETKKDKIDLLINNAGFGLMGNFVETDLERELEMIDVNIKALHILTKLFLKDFIARDKGYILNVASSAGFMAGPHLSAYYATKNYNVRLSMAIKEELKYQKSNVSISVLCPGPVDTEFNDVAGVAFAMKGVSAASVAKLGIDKTLSGKFLIVPTLRMKLLIFGNRFVPYSWSTKIAGSFQRKKKGTK